MIHYRRESLPPSLKALAWREPPDPETDRGRLVVVVNDHLSAGEARTAARDAVRKLPRQPASHRVSGALGALSANSALASMATGNGKLGAVALILGALAAGAASVGH